MTATAMSLIISSFITGITEDISLLDAIIVVYGACLAVDEHDGVHLLTEDISSCPTDRGFCFWCLSSGRAFSAIDNERSNGSQACLIPPLDHRQLAAFSVNVRFCALCLGQGPFIWPVSLRM